VTGDVKRDLSNRHIPFADAEGEEAGASIEGCAEVAVAQGQAGGRLLSRGVQDEIVLRDPARDEGEGL